MYIYFLYNIYIYIYMCMYVYVHEESLNVCHLTDFIKSHQTLLPIARFYEARKRSILRKQAKYPKKASKVS